MTDGIEERKRWLTLIVLCLGVLMIVLDTTIVAIAAAMASALARAFVGASYPSREPRAEGQRLRTASHVS